VRSWYVVQLWHPDPGKALELARAKDPALIERRARDWARRLGLPLSRQQFEPTAPAAERPSEVVAATVAAKPRSTGRVIQPEAATR
jgi:hypothetical protein